MPQRQHPKGRHPKGRHCRSRSPCFRHPVQSRLFRRRCRPRFVSPALLFLPEQQSRLLFLQCCSARLSARLQNFLLLRARRMFRICPFLRSLKQVQTCLPAYCLRQLPYLPSGSVRLCPHCPGLRPVSQCLFRLLLPSARQCLFHLLPCFAQQCLFHLPGSARQCLPRLQLCQLRRGCFLPFA